MAMTVLTTALRPNDRVRAAFVRTGGQMHDEQFSTVVGGLVFPEGLRWRRDRLWFTDVEARRVFCCDTNGIVLVAFDTEQHPVGLGWDTASKLVISTLEQRLLRYDGRAISGDIDLGALVA